MTLAPSAGRPALRDAHSKTNTLHRSWLILSYFIERSPDFFFPFFFNYRRAEDPWVTNRLFSRCCMPLRNATDLKTKPLKFSSQKICLFVTATQKCNPTCGFPTYGIHWPLFLRRPTDETWRLRNHTVPSQKRCPALAPRIAPAQEAWHMSRAARRLTGAVTVVVRVSVALSALLCGVMIIRQRLLLCDLDTKDALVRVFLGMDLYSASFSETVLKTLHWYGVHLPCIKLKEGGGKSDFWCIWKFTQQEWSSLYTNEGICGSRCLKKLLIYLTVRTG